jgi:hypothetical protein
VAFNRRVVVLNAQSFFPELFYFGLVSEFFLGYLVEIEKVIFDCPILIVDKTTINSDN